MVSWKAICLARAGSSTGSSTSTGISTSSYYFSRYGKEAQCDLTGQQLLLVGRIDSAQNN
jgi:ketol-acid reductoisomerase